MDNNIKLTIGIESKKKNLIIIDRSKTEELGAYIHTYFNIYSFYGKVAKR